MKLFSVKAVPVVFWSSERPLNIKPKLSTLSILCFGLVLFGLGEAALIAAGAGVSSWTVLAQGVANITGWSVGLSNFVISFAVLLFWIPLRQTPGMGTVLNAIIISATIEASLPYLPRPDLYALKMLETVIGILLVGMGSGLYLIANLGPGPRDGLMTGLQRVTRFPIAWVRTTLEFAVVACGWMLGGTVGLGTLMSAFGVGPAVSIGLYVVWSLSRRSESSRA